MKSLILAVAAAFLLPAIVRGEPLSCPTGTRPLLKVLDYWDISGPPPEAERRGVTTICTGGTVLTASIGGARGHLVPAYGSLSRGTASTAAMASLATTMGNVHIGALLSCHFLVTHGIDVIQDITWYGARGRVNRFTLSTLDPALPNCEANSGFQLFAAIQDVVESAGSSPSAP
jgi:hypothetical protein